MLQHCGGHKDTPEQGSLVQPDPPGSPTARGHLGATGPGTHQRSQGSCCVPQQRASPHSPTSCPRPPSLGSFSPQPLPQKGPVAFPYAPLPGWLWAAAGSGPGPQRRRRRTGTRKVPGAAMGAADQGRVRTASPRAAGFRTTLLPAPHCFLPHSASCPTAPPAPGSHLMGTTAHSSGAPRVIPVGPHSSSHWDPMAHPSGTPWLIPLGYHSLPTRTPQRIPTGTVTLPAQFPPLTPLGPPSSSCHVPMAHPAML